MIHPLRAIAMFAQGLSWWHVELTTNRIWSQLDTVHDPLRGIGKGQMRPLDWYLDLVATGDSKKIKAIVLHSPKGDVALRIDEPGTCYQLNVAGLLFGMGGDGLSRQKDAQIIGRVDDKEAGTGIAFIWDSPLQQMFKDESANVLNFQGWREGIAPIGALNIAGMGLVL